MPAFASRNRASLGLRRKSGCVLLARTKATTNGQRVRRPRPRPGAGAGLRADQGERQDPEPDRRRERVAVRVCVRDRFASTTPASGRRRNEAAATISWAVGREERRGARSATDVAETATFGATRARLRDGERNARAARARPAGARPPTRPRSTRSAARAPGRAQPVGDGAQHDDRCGQDRDREERRATTGWDDPAARAGLLPRPASCRAGRRRTSPHPARSASPEVRRVALRGADELDEGEQRKQRAGEGEPDRCVDPRAT